MINKERLPDMYIYSRCKERKKEELSSTKNGEAKNVYKKIDYYAKLFIKSSVIFLYLVRFTLCFTY